MKLSNLQALADKYQDTISLIERCFGYKPENRFDVDFYPLMKKENLKNCWIITQEDEVVAHSGVLKRTFVINGKSFNVLFIGGVAVDEKHRGEGHSSTLLKHIFDTYPHVSLFVLWSEKTEMYKKHGFFPCVELFEHPQKPEQSEYLEVDPSKLSAKDLQDIQTLYQNDDEIRVHRNEVEWSDVFKIQSSRLFVKKHDGRITNYFFMDKGQDLKGVIHEYGNLKDATEMRHHGRLWSTLAYEGATPLYGSLIKPGDTKLFSAFTEAATGISIKSFNQSVSFVFEEESFELPLEEFMTGAFGPGRFQELASCPKLFISGLDSI